MTIEGKSYLASDLASELGLPRSTINDWLTRYADYLESESRGKRRAYSEKSLSILREIGDLRNRGLSSFDVEQQLASRYGLRPEVAPSASADSAAAGAPEETSADSPAEGGEDGSSAVRLPALTPDAALPVLRPVLDELAGRFDIECGKLSSQLEKLEAERRRLIRRIWTMGAALLFGVAALLMLLGVTLYVLYGRMERESHSTRGAVERLSSGIAERGELTRREAEAAAARLDEMNVVLDRSRSDFQRNLAALQAELGEQRKAFEQQVRKLEADAATRSEAEVIKLREEFARKQQAELQKLVSEHEAKLQAVAGEAAASSAARKTAEEAAASARKELEKGRRELEELRARFKELDAARAGREAAPASPAAGATP